MSGPGVRAPIDLRASLAQVRAGGIPLRAEQRLADEASPDRRFFTSDLSVNEFRLVSEAGCEPISQVMGSCIFHVGQIPDYKGKTAEISVLSNAHRESRRAALARLVQEAALLRADAIIGVHLNERMITMGARGKGGDDGGEILEFTVVGTAVRAPWITHTAGQPVATDLSGQDLWALAQDGFEPAGFLFEFCRYHVWHVAGGEGGGIRGQPGVALAVGSARKVGELEAASHAIEEARSIATDRLLAQARACGAEFVVGSDMTIKMREVPCGAGGCQLDDLDIDISWFGTAIRQIPNAQIVARPTPSLMLSMLPLGRRRHDDLEAEDDADDVEIAAEEAQEAALEMDEDSNE